jgi:Ser-tRNA(Ala) deacylase AlaX
MTTELLYLQDFDVVECEATVVVVATVMDGRTDVQLDKSCFYARGGGQDWDTGRIKGLDSLAVFEVHEVRLDESAVIHHIGTFKSGQFKVGERVECAVDTQRRTVNTRLHSAGHMVDLAVDRLKLDWKPVKGGHYPHMSFVEYEGIIDPGQVESISQQIETIANDVIAKGSQNEIRFIPVSEMYTICRHVPDNIPTNKPARVVIYDGTFGVPCGGTHVRDVGDIGHITIAKIKSKKGLIRVSYAVEGIN